MGELIGRAVCGRETLDVISAVWPESWWRDGDLRSLATRYVTGILPYLLVDIPSIGLSRKDVSGLRIGSWGGEPITFAQPNQRLYRDSERMERLLQGRIELSVDDDVLEAASTLRPIFDRHGVAGCEVSDGGLVAEVDTRGVDEEELLAFLREIGPHARSRSEVVVTTDSDDDEGEIIRYRFDGADWTGEKVPHGEEIFWDVLSEFCLVVGQEIRHSFDDVPKSKRGSGTLSVSISKMREIGASSKRLTLMATFPDGRAFHVCPECLGIGGSLVHWCWSDAATLIHCLIADLKGDDAPGSMGIRDASPFDEGGVMGTLAGANLWLASESAVSVGSTNISTTAATQYNRYVRSKIFSESPCRIHRS